MTTVYISKTMGIVGGGDKRRPKPTDLCPSAPLPFGYFR